MSNKICSKCGQELNDSDKFCQNCGTKVEVINNYIYAGFGARLGAALIDGLIIYGIAILIFIIPVLINMLLSLTTGKTEMVKQFISLIQYTIPMFIVFFGIIIYRGVKDATERRTVGRRTTKTKVIDQNGNMISTGTSFGRQVVSALINATGIGFIANIILIASDEKHQSLSDEIFNTYIIKTN